MKRSIHTQISLFVAGVLFGLVVTTCSRPVADKSPADATATSPLIDRALQPAPAFASTGGPPSGVTLADVAQHAVPSVVNVSATRVGREFRHDPFFSDPFRDFFGPRLRPRSGPQRSLGSGVIVSADGLVLTNNHVVEHAQEVRVTLKDGRELTAEIVGADPKSDLAVLRLQGDVGTLQPIPIGDSDELRLGDVVLAIGNPFGVGQTVTMGIVSALGRDNVDIVDYEDFIQTDAAINPGNSGGALVNMRGELVGINTAILSRSGGYQGIGFAIPSNMAKPVMDSLVSNGKVVRGWLGVSIQTLDDDLASGLGIDLDQGVVISDVTDDSPAARGGLERGDVIVSLDGKPMATAAKLRNAIAAAGPGKGVELEVVRAGKRKTLRVTLGEVPADAGGGAAVEPEEGALAGAVISALDDATRSRFRIPKTVKSGVVVTEVEDGSAAQRAGLRPGDVLREVNRKAVGSVAEFRKAYQSAQTTLLLLVQRGNATIYIAIRK